VNATSSSTWDRIDRSGWWLWGVTIAVVLALAATVPMLYLPLLRILEDRDDRLPLENYYALVGLLGLVAVFCLYTALKQRELDAMRRRLEQEEREKANVGTRLSELSALFQLATTLNLQLQLDEILEIVVRRVVSTLQAQQASIMILDPATSLLETRASYGLESEFARHARKKLGEGIAGWVAERREAVQLDSDAGMGAFRGEQKTNRNITSALSLPLKVGDRCVGVLNVNRINHPEIFQPHHCEVLQLFADHVGSVVERAGRKRYNTALVFDPKGDLVARYRKVFPWMPYETLDRGTEPPPVFTVPRVGTFGLFICYDGWFPEMARSLALRGAEVLLHPTLTTTADREQELVLARANAITNQCYVLNVNSVPSVGGGRSIGVDPHGRVLFELGHEEGFAIETLDLGLVREARTNGTAGLNRVLLHVREAPPAAFDAYRGLGRRR